MKIASLTLNPCIDKTLYVSNAFRVGELNRASSSVYSAGGKGINVSRLQKKLGVDVRSFGFAGGSFGEILQSLLKEEQITYSFTRTECETRTCIKIIDGTGECSEINESGGPIREEEWTALLSQLSDFRRECETEDGILVASGSIPRPLPSDAYRRIINMFEGSRVRVVLDADGDALKQGLKERPWLIKPNLHEISAYLGREIVGENEYQLAEATAAAGCEILRRFGSRVICTMGSMGAVYVSGSGATYVNAPGVSLRSFAGAGDTFLSTFLFYHCIEMATEEDAMRFASAMAAARVSLEASYIPDKEDMERFLDQVRIVPMNHVMESFF